MLWTQQVLAGRHRPRGRAELRRRQRLHRPGRLPGHAPHRRAPAPRCRCRRSIGAGEVAVCSTGLIGERLPWTSCWPGVDAAATRPGRADGGRGRGRRDQDHRHGAQDRAVAGARLQVGGMAKGAGMLAPALATMLVRAHHRRGVPTGRAGRRAARSATGVTFDRIDSDGCMSTNDTVLLLASGACGVTPTAAEFAAALTAACADLARQLHRRRRGRQQGRSRSRSPARRASRTRSRSAARSPAATCSSPRSSARTRTGAGCSPPSAPPAPPSSRTSSTSRSTASGCAAPARRRGPVRGRPAGRGGHHHRRPAAGDDGGDDLDQRPHRRRTCTRTRRTRHDAYSDTGTGGRRPRPPR